MTATRHRRRIMPELNTTSTADISFMLLIFFLVTTSMDTDRGITRTLPPPTPQQQQQTPAEEQRRNVMRIDIQADGTVMLNDRAQPIATLAGQMERFVDNPANRTDLPEKTMARVPLIGRHAVSDRHLFIVTAHPEAPYQAYFDVQNSLTQTYNTLRNRLAQTVFHRTYEQCTPRQRDAVRQCYPQRISEQYTTTQP